VSALPVQRVGVCPSGGCVLCSTSGGFIVFYFSEISIMGIMLHL
jgi:hypothetical protein